MGSGPCPAGTAGGPRRACSPATPAWWTTSCGRASRSQVIFERLLGQGYAGGLTTVKTYIAAHRDLVPAKRRQAAPQGLPRPALPGRRPEEAYQMDWGFVAVERPGGERARIACFAMGLPPLRERPRRVLPERAPGEPPHPGCCVLGAGRADRAHRQHEERGRPAAMSTAGPSGRPTTPSSWASSASTRLCRPRHLYEGQGGETRPLREGELPRGKVLHRP